MSYGWHAGDVAVVSGRATLATVMMRAGDAIQPGSLPVRYVRQTGQSLERMPRTRWGWRRTFARLERATRLAPG